MERPLRTIGRPFVSLQGPGSIPASRGHQRGCCRAHPRPCLLFPPRGCRSPPLPAAAPPQEQPETELTLRATAGLRLLPKAQSGAILEVGLRALAFPRRRAMLRAAPGLGLLMRSQPGLSLVAPLASLASEVGADSRRCHEKRAYWNVFVCVYVCVFVCTVCVVRARVCVCVCVCVCVVHPHANAHTWTSVEARQSSVHIARWTCTCLHTRTRTHAHARARAVELTGVTRRAVGGPPRALPGLVMRRRQEVALRLRLAVE